MKSYLHKKVDFYLVLFYVFVKTFENSLFAELDFLFSIHCILTLPDATYLGWLDFTQTNIPGSPFDFFLKNAKVFLSDGKIFGKAGEGHVRINFGTSRALLEEGLDKMRKAMSQI